MLASLLLVLPALAQDAVPAELAPDAVTAIDSGDTAWLLVSTLLVILMTIPGVALFYGGLVRAKNILSVLTQVFGAFAMIALLWVAYGYSLAFSGGGEGGLAPYIGGLSNLFLAQITPDSVSGTVPELVFVVFQLTFACITATLVVGGIAERMKFGGDHDLPRHLVHLLLSAHRPHGVVGQRVVLHHGRARFCRRHRGAYQFGYRCAGCRHRAGPAPGLSQGAAGPAQSGVHLYRRLPPLGGLVRLQCRLGPERQWRGRPGVP